MEFLGGTPSPAPRLLLEDETAAHQIRLRFVGRRIGVSCTCLATGPRGGYQMLETRMLFPSGEAVQVWRAHLPAAPEAQA